MRPLLFELSLPFGSVPLFVVWGLLAVAGVAILLLGRRAGERDAMRLGAIIAIAALGLAAASGSRRYEGAVYPIHAFGALLGFGLAFGFVLASRAALRSGLASGVVVPALVVSIVGAFVGARLFYFLANARGVAWGDVLAWQTGGLALYGALFAGVLGVWVFGRRHRLPLLAFFDAVTPGACAAAVFGWVGSYLAGSDYGRELPSTAPEWLKRLGTFPRWAPGTVPSGDGSPAFVHHALEGRVSPFAKASLPVHPTQLYEALVAAALLVLVIALQRRQRVHGIPCLAAVAVYGVVRFGLETLRGDADRGAMGPLTVSQACALFTAAIAAGLLVRQQRVARTLRPQ